VVGVAEGVADGDVAVLAFDFPFDPPKITIPRTMSTAITAIVPTLAPRTVLRRLARARRSCSAWRRRSCRRRASSRSRRRLVATKSSGRVDLE
jgi:hypothetical protein